MATAYSFCGCKTHFELQDKKYGAAGPDYFVEIPNVEMQDKSIELHDTTLKYKTQLICCKPQTLGFRTNIELKNNLEAIDHNY